MDETTDTGGEDQLLGTLLDERYEIQESLGSGGMGRVYLAWDRKLERKVVVKIPHSNLMTDPAFRRRFLQEIRDLANHEHPAILRIEGSGSHGDLPYAVVQYLGGGNLAERIASRGGQETPAEILEWLPTIADALDTVHKNGSLHRDVKPANILFDGRGNAVLSDFGIATAIGAADPDEPTQVAVPELTIVGSFIGSPAYAPPEAIDRIFTPAYDQYSLATVVYLALTGALPFSGRTNEAILISKERESPAGIDRRRLKAPLSRSAERAIMKALSHGPDDRFATCSEFARAFTRDAMPAWPNLSWSRIALAAGALSIAFVALTQREWSTTTIEVEQPAWPVEVQLGSTSEEIDRAITICERGGGNERECARDIFAEEHLRAVTLSAFEIDRHEITNADFAKFSDASGHVSTAEERGYSWDITRCRRCSWQNPRPDRSALDHPDDPVVHVSWADARAYCGWSGSRLPTEDEWEFIARGVGRRMYPWGNDWDPTRVRNLDTQGVGLEPVGSRPEGATRSGILDLAGSVWEWTSTPSGSGERRIIKGGSWTDRNPAHLRSAALSDLVPEHSSIDLGFRCARSLESP